EFAGSDGSGRLLQGRDIFGKRPLVDGNGGDQRTAFAQPGQQFLGRSPVLLNGHLQALEGVVDGNFVIENAKNFAPGVRFGSDEGGFYADFAQSRYGFNASGHDDGSFEGSGDFLPGVGTFDGAKESTRAGAGKENDQVEFAGKQATGEIQ